MNKKVVVWIVVLALVGLGWWAYSQGYIFTSPEDQALNEETQALEENLDEISDLADDSDLGEELIVEVPEE